MALKDLQDKHENRTQCESEQVPRKKGFLNSIAGSAKDMAKNTAKITAENVAKKSFPPIWGGGFAGSPARGL